MAVDGEGMSALHFAAEYGHTEVVSVLLEAGADVMALDYRGHSALKVTARCGHTNVVSVLLEAGTHDLVVDGEGSNVLRLPAEFDCDAKPSAVFLEAGADVRTLEDDGKRLSTPRPLVNVLTHFFLAPLEKAAHTTSSFLRTLMHAARVLLFMVWAWTIRTTQLRPAALARRAVCYHAAEQDLTHK
jgi:ankyrin repeat protein